MFFDKDKRSRLCKRSKGLVKLCGIYFVVTLLFTYSSDSDSTLQGIDFISPVYSQALLFVFVVA